jgi:hypothetical protein
LIGHWIDDPNEHERRRGETLATKSRDVIRRWAEKRGAEPSTVPGTEHQGAPGVLTFDFPGYGGENLRHVDWEEWLGTFERRGLTFLYQEHRKDGRESNFFRLDNPDREEA